MDKRSKIQTYDVDIGRVVYYRQHLAALREARKKAEPSLSDIRRAVADYMRSEGCGCCSDTESHDAHKAVLAKLLGVRKYSDGSGYDFSPHETKPRSKK